MKTIKLMTLLVILGSLTFSCGKNDDDDKKKDVPADATFTVKETGENSFEFKIVSTSYDSLVWKIENKLTRGVSQINQSFSDTGVFEISLTVFGRKEGVVISDNKMQSVHCVAHYDVAQINTSFGDIFFYLYQSTPLHKANFIKLANEGYFDGTTFHRVIPGFVIQGGDPNSKDADPNNDGNGGPGYTIPAEFNTKIRHNQGAVASARLPDNINPQKESSGSQFYIVEPKAGTHQLDMQYTIFGQVISGPTVVTTIANQPASTDKARPFTDIPMTVKMLRMTVSELKSNYAFSIPAE